MTNKVMYSSHTAKDRLRGSTALWLTTNQVAEILSISPDRVRAYVDDGKLRKTMVRSRIMISRGSLERFISYQQQKELYSKPRAT